MAHPAGVFVGLATLDLIHRVPTPLGPDEKVTALRQDLAAGGPAANAAVTFAALGGRPTLLTALGRHPLALLVVADLADHGVTVLDATPAATTPPAVSAIRVVDTNGARSVSSVNAAASTVAFADELPAADVLLVDGHHPGLAVPAAVQAQARGIPVLLDAGSWKPVLATLARHVDQTICSAAFRPPPDAPAFRGAVAVTHGAGPIDWWAGEDAGRLPVPAVAAVDTLGAGDVFHGAAAFALATGMSQWPDVLRFATRVAGIRVRHPGPRVWLEDGRLTELRGSTR